MEVNSTDQPAADEQEDGRQSNNHRRPPIPSFSLQGLDTGSAPPTSPSQSIGSRSRQEEDRLTQQEEEEEDVDPHPDFTAAHDEMDDDAAASISSSFSHDDTSDDDSSSSSDEDGNDTLQLSLRERMLRNQTRNAEFLRSLNEKYQEQIPAVLKRSRASRKRKINTETKYDEEADRKHRGMLRKVQATTSISKESNSRTLGERLRSLMAQYPHRESQIHQLAALLHGSVGACHTTPKGSLALQVPAPIFISGPPSTGKTSVVKDVVKALHNERLHSAYIHCETLEPSSVERLVSDAYRQLRATIDIQHHHSGWPKRRRLGSSSKKLPHSPMMHRKDNKILSPKSSSAAKVAAARKENAPANLAKLISDFDTDQDANPRLQPRRAVKEATKPAQINLISSKSQKLRKMSKVKSKGPSIEQKSHHDDEQVETSHSAVVAFGRSLQQHFGQGSGRSAVLVLDHAERLLRLSARKKANEKSNCLAELLLLPKVMQLNLTIVLISQYSLLHHTRLDNLASAEKSTPSLLESTGGLTIQFPTYSSKDEFVQVLKSERILGRIIGRTPVTSLSKRVVHKVVDAFLTSLVQFLSDTTLDSNEFVRIGRSLWPVYIHPLQPSEITETFNSLNIGAKEAGIPNEELDGEILEFLGRRLLVQFSKLSRDLTRLHLDSTGSLAGIPSRPCKMSELGLPFLQTCLLLAAFICQHNRAENDKKVFSVHGNGKRRKSRKGNEGNDDDIALGSNGSAMEQLKSLRPRPFLVERVFSIFVTLVRLNPDAVPDIAGTRRPDFSIDSLGSARLYDDLRCLMDLGFIHEISYTGDVKAEKINVNSGKFWCSLTAEKASDLAASVGIPLDSYLV